MYVDESGDCGLTNSPTRYFVLTRLVVHELRWRQCLDQFADFRRRMREWLHEEEERPELLPAS